MAFKSGLVLVAGVSCVLGQYKVNDVSDVNYIVTPFNNAEFPCAPGFCNPQTVIGGKANIATCLDDELIRYDQYSGTICFGEPDSLPVYYTSASFMNMSDELNTMIEADLAENYATLENEIFDGITIDDVEIEVTQTGTGSLFDFKCDGANEYTKISFQVGKCDGNDFYTYYAALNTCVQNCGNNGADKTLDPQDYTSLSVYCNANLAELQYFENPDTCDFSNCTQATFYQVRNVTRTCGYMLTSGESEVYGYIEECSVDPYVPATTEESASEDGASGVHGVIALLVSTIVTIVAMFV